MCPCSIIVSVRETCADWQRGVEPQSDPALKGKKDPETGFGIKVPRRNVGKERYLGAATGFRREMRNLPEK